jgi:hypothetical protein
MALFMIANARIMCVPSFKNKRILNHGGALVDVFHASPYCVPNIHESVWNMVMGVFV